MAAEACAGSCHRCVRLQGLHQVPGPRCSPACSHFRFLIFCGSAALRSLGAGRDDQSSALSRRQISQYMVFECRLLSTYPIAKGVLIASQICLHDLVITCVLKMQLCSDECCMQFSGQDDPAQAHKFKHTHSAAHFSTASC